MSVVVDPRLDAVRGEDILVRRPDLEVREPTVVSLKTSFSGYIKQYDRWQRGARLEDRLA